MTVDTLYQNFLEELDGKQEYALFSKVEDLILNVKKLMLQRNSNFLSDIFSLERSFYNSLYCISQASRTMITAYLPLAFFEQSTIWEALMKMEQSPYKAMNKIEILVGMIAFSSRIENSVSTFEGGKAMHYDFDQYLLFGDFLRNILDPYHDWIVPIITSKQVEKHLFHGSKEESYCYLTHIYEIFYQTFFPEGKQSMDHFDLFSYVDLYTQAQYSFLESSFYMKQLYDSFDCDDSFSLVKGKHFS